MPSVLDEIVEKSVSLTFEERQKLIDLLHKQEVQTENAPINPNILWLRENRDKFAGKYVALLDGKLIGQGRTIKEAHLEAKASGANKPLLTYIPRENEELWGGW